MTLAYLANQLHHQIGHRILCSSTSSTSIELSSKTSPKECGCELEPNRIIKNDKMFVYEFEVQSSHQAAEWRGPDGPKPRITFD